MRPKVALLYVGGALGIETNRKTGKIDPVESLGEIQRLMPEIQREASLTFIPVANVESPDVNPEHWVSLAQAIERHYDQFEGFVVIHGTNTLTYTACALSFALQGLGKPIVFTGALLPINETGSDFRSNLTFAIRTALLDIAEVCVVFGTTILRGCRSKKVREAVGETFGSTRFPPLGKFTRTFELHPWRMMRRKRTLQCIPTFDPAVTMLTLHPGLPEGLLRATMDANLSGLVMRAYGPGMIPDSLIVWIRELQKRSIPIVMTSQVLDSMVDLHQYRKQLALEKLGIISGKDMTYECALTKLMWVLAQTKDPQRIRTLMEKSLVGELTE